MEYLLLGGGLLLMLGLSKGKSAGGGGAGTGGTTRPGTGSTQLPNLSTTSGSGLQTGISIGTGILSAAGTVVGALAKAGVIGGASAASSAGGGGGAAGGGTATLSTSGGASGAGTASGSGTGVIGGGAIAFVDTMSLVGLGLWAIGIIAVIVQAWLGDMIASYHTAVATFLGESRGLNVNNAQKFFVMFMQQYSAALNNGTVKSKMPPTAMREVLRTSLFLAWKQAEARNQVLADFYASLGWTQADWDTPYTRSMNAQAWPNLWTAEDTWNRTWSWAKLTSMPGANCPGDNGQGGYQLQSAVARSYQSLINANDWCTVVAPCTQGDLEAAARSVLGDKYNSVINTVRFAGQVAAIAAAAIQGFTATWPGDEAFVRGLADRTGGDWSAVNNAYIVTEGSPLYKGRPLMTWWLVDSKSGMRIAPVETRDSLTLVISRPGVEVAPGMFAGATDVVGRSTFAGYAGRRLNRFAIMTGGRYGRR